MPDLKYGSNKHREIDSHRHTHLGSCVCVSVAAFLCVREGGRGCVCVCGVHYKMVLVSAYLGVCTLQFPQSFQL